MLNFGSAPGNLMNRLGKLGALVANIRSYQNSQLTAMTDTVNGVVAQFNAESDIQSLMGSSYIPILLAVGGNIGPTAAVMAQATVNRMVFRDNPQFGQTLTQANLLASIAEVIRQMQDQGATVLALTVTGTASGVDGIGNGAAVVSVRRPADGLIQQNAYAEDLTLACSQDSYVGGATEGNESFTLTGVGNETDVWAFDWPLGSNASTSLTAINGNSDNSAGNLLTNSGFSDWTTNVPDNFQLVVGTAGTNVNQETTIVYDGSSSALRLTGDGTTLTQLRQAFGSTSGTSGELEPLTQYAFNVFARRDGTAAAAGQLIVDLTDQNGTVINDEAGTPNSLTIDLTALSTVYTSYNTSFRTPLVLPSQTYWRMRMPTGQALTNGRSVYFDRAGLGVMTQAYLSGPWAAVFSGGVPFNTGDFFTLAITNSRGAAGTLGTFQTLWARFLPQMYQNELLLPYSAAPSISDGLIA